ncbi:MAG: glycosyltransferase [Deltaproteobacteria bacterium]|nr:glycosyltransferase [Deltaproteobacteria bacterium]
MKNNLNFKTNDSLSDGCLVSIIIPVAKINHYIIKAIPHYLKMTYKNFEIIILPDEEDVHSFEKSIIIPTGHVGPAIKRNIGAKIAKGGILAFIDDDAYPQENWLLNALAILKDESIAAVGGPAITPDEDEFFQKVSGSVFLTKISGIDPRKYYPIGKSANVKEWPSVNFIIKKNIFLAIKGFSSDFWPGEDTELCFKITEIAKRIVYDPSTIVYHHRRGNFIIHLKQIGNYGIARGWLAKKHPLHSFKLKYFLSSLFVLYFLITFISLFLSFKFFAYLSLGLLFYIFTLFFTFFDINKKTKNIKISLFGTFYTFLTHIYYGITFSYGFLFVKKLKKLS